MYVKKCNEIVNECVWWMARTKNEFNVSPVRLTGAKCTATNTQQVAVDKDVLLWGKKKNGLK